MVNGNNINNIHQNEDIHDIISWLRAINYDL